MDKLAIVKDIIGKRVDVSNLKEDDSLLSLGLDSLDLVEVMLEIEDSLNIEFSSEEISDLKTIKDVINAIDKKVVNS